MPQGKGVLIIGETSDGQLSPITNELLAVGRKLADELGEELVAAVMGTSVQDLAREAIPSGADRAYAVEDPLLNDPSAFDAQVAAATKLCQEVSPRIVLLGRTNTGRDVAPRLAFRLDAGLANDCVELWVDKESKRLMANRPVYGGSAIATVSCQGDIQVASVRPKVYEPLEPDNARQGEVVPFPAKLDASAVRVRLIDRVKADTAGVRLEDARVVVSGGRGLGSPDSFQQLEELAKLLGGAVGCSRAVCDAGWLDHSYQIGLTGKSISPDLYITIAISGASQHMAGCSGAKNIVAINKDAEANIFQECRYGVVGDWQKILSAFIEEVRELVK